MSDQIFKQSVNNIYYSPIFVRKNIYMNIIYGKK